MQQEHEALTKSLKEQYENNYNASKIIIEQQILSIEQQYKISITENSEILQKEIDDQKERNDLNEKMQNLVLVSVKENYETDIRNLKTESNSLLEKMKFLNFLRFLTLEKKNKKSSQNIENKIKVEYVDREERERDELEWEKEELEREREEMEREERVRKVREREERVRVEREIGEKAQLEADARAAVLQVQISERTYH